MLTGSRKGGSENRVEEEEGNTEGDTDEEHNGDVLVRRKRKVSNESLVLDV